MTAEDLALLREQAQFARDLVEGMPSIHEEADKHTYYPLGMCFAGDLTAAEMIARLDEYVSQLADAVRDAQAERDEAQAERDEAQAALDAAARALDDAVMFRNPDRVNDAAEAVMGLRYPMAVLPAWS